MCLVSCIGLMCRIHASVSSSSWIPEDDLLLKNAIESGASLEALAKGAVRFSWKFTFKELEDRWRALLYDPVISCQATTRIIELSFDRFQLDEQGGSIRLNRWVMEDSRKTAANAITLRRVDGQVNKAILAANRATTAARVGVVRAVQYRMDGKFW